MLQKIKRLLGIEDATKDDLLLLLIDNAIQFAINYTHNEHCLGIIESTIIKMVVVDYNKLGSEGLNSESYSGVSFNYQQSYSEDIMAALRAHRKVRVIHA